MVGLLVAASPSSQQQGMLNDAMQSAWSGPPLVTTTHAMTKARHVPGTGEPLEGRALASRAACQLWVTGRSGSSCPSKRSRRPSGKQRYPLRSSYMCCPSPAQASGLSCLFWNCRCQSLGMPSPSHTNTSLAETAAAQSLRCAHMPSACSPSYAWVSVGLLHPLTWHAQVGENRIVSLDSAPEEESGAAPALIVQDDGTFRHERSWRGSAIAMPVFALRSRDSIGAGEFQDLKKLVTLCHQAGKLPTTSPRCHCCVCTGEC